MLGVYGKECYIQNFGVGITKHFGPVSFDFSIDLFGFTGITIGFTSQTSQGESHTSAFTIGVNTGTLAAVLIIIIELIAGGPVPIPAPNYF